jgi:hypothetical protein
VKFGGDVRFKENAIDALSQGRGEFTFTGQFTGSGLADLLLGLTTVARLSTPLRGDFRDRSFAAYVSDTWKVASRVTLTLGARYDVQTPMWERQTACPTSTAIRQARRSARSSPRGTAACARARSAPSISTTLLPAPA